MKKAPPPTVPYLGILLSEVSSVVEGLPTYLEDKLVNFSKMRRVGACREREGVQQLIFSLFAVCQANNRCITS